jgi:hypothetical protein
MLSGIFFFEMKNHRIQKESAEIHLFVFQHHNITANFRIFNP